ncbi:MAG TPA: SulP family inorganic anion transporter [Caldimonas sp.]|nr:SulP family inorganic anion transporter [Caldimonas sp.]HEX2541215.1 SulP family inorganic anion transporter [Caldimonas sp.]
MLDSQPARDSIEPRARRPAIAPAWLSPATAAAWRRDLQAGAVGAVVTLASWLALPLLAYLSLGAPSAALGMPAAAAAALVGGTVVAMLGRSAMPAAGLSSATTLLFAAGVAALSGDPALQPLSAPAIALLVATISCCVVLMGVLQMLFGWLRLGAVAKYVPQPVLAGFMNSVAVLLLVGQLPALLGLAATSGGAVVPWLARWQPATLLVGLVTAASVWLIGWRWPRAPAALLALAFGCALYALVRFAWPGAALGPQVGPLPQQLPLPDVLVPLFATSTVFDLFLRHAEHLIVTALALAIVGSLETVLNALATDERVNARHEPNRELVAFGAGNIASGIFGGLPLTYQRSRAAALLANGASSRRAAGVCAVVTGTLLAIGGPLIGLLPLTVLAGLMVTLAWSLVDQGTRRAVARLLTGELSRELRLNLAIVAAVFAMTLWLGIVTGVVVGVLLAMALFVHSMNRSLIRASYRATAQPSRRVYPRAQEDFLRTARQRIAIVELEGALFFGNADTLAAQIETLDPEVATVVLDLRRVSTLDSSGAGVLAQLVQRLATQGRTLLLAGVSADNRHGRALRDLGTFDGHEQPQRFDDLDRAVEFAEQSLLSGAGLGGGTEAVPLDECSLLRGVDPARRDRLKAAMPVRRLRADEKLFRQGDPGDALYVVTEGSITACSPGTHGAHRYLSLSPGMMLGETALLDGRGRTADAVADVESVVHVLGKDTLARIADEDPELARQITTNIAVHLSERLRSASAAWQVAAS